MLFVPVVAVEVAEVAEPEKVPPSAEIAVCVETFV